jgi:hypothetical protein
MSKGKMGIGDLLDQAEIWQYRDSSAGELVTIKIADMDLNHILNLRRWLTENARRLHASEVLALYSMSAMISGEAASDDLASSIADAETVHPIGWLRDKPLYQALGQEIHRRQGSKGNPSLRRHLTVAERENLAAGLRTLGRELDDTGSTLACSGTIMSVAGYNAQINSLIEKLRRLRKS